MCSPNFCYLFFFLGDDGLCYFCNNEAPYSFSREGVKKHEQICMSYVQISYNLLKTETLNTFRTFSLLF